MKKHPVEAKYNLSCFSENKLSKVLTTDKQKAFLRNRMAGMNKRQAAVQAGYAPSTASIVAKRLTDKLSCNTIFLEECERQGLTVHAIVKELKRGVTKAMDPHKPDQPDNFNRRSYTDMALKIYGAYPPTKIELDQRKLEIHLTPEVLERIKEIKGDKEFKKLISDDVDEKEGSNNQNGDPPF